MTSKTNINKARFLSIKKIYITAISFLSIISFGAGINVNAAGSSTLLPISRGGTNANTAAQAATNLLGSNFANYSGVLPVDKGGTGATNASSAQTNLQSELTIKYDINEIKEKYVKICSGSAAASSQGDEGTICQISGLQNANTYPFLTYISVTPRTKRGDLPPNTFILFMTNNCDAQNLTEIYYVDNQRQRDYYSSPNTLPNPITVTLLQKGINNMNTLSKGTLDVLPSGAVEVKGFSYCLTTSAPTPTPTPTITHSP